MRCYTHVDCEEPEDVCKTAEIAPEGGASLSCYPPVVFQRAEALRAKRDGSAAIDEQLTEELNTYCYMVEARCRPTGKHLDKYSEDRACIGYRQRHAWQSCDGNRRCWLRASFLSECQPRTSTAVAYLGTGGPPDSVADLRTLQRSRTERLYLHPTSGNSRDRGAGARRACAS
jgi:hypothetical protein